MNDDSPDQELPSRIDLRTMTDAREWEATAMSKRPYRRDVFARMARELNDWTPPVRRVLELGSGPGFLARSLLDTLDDITYVMLDFSPAMHELSRDRLGPAVTCVEFCQSDLKAADWMHDRVLSTVS
jgi:ubiquinone/menaquinone biosynthesis C-methylase UbiE